ncbi:hypothetical protein MASR2M8_10030 [Opitutaceae bacterium]|jgi:hypothetical protein
MLKASFAWLDTHPWAYWLIVAPPTIACLLQAWHALRRKPAAQESPWTDLRYDLLMFGVLLAWRWPFLFAAQAFNPDESHLIAGALTLARNPVFWQAVDGTTSGPLNFYALLPLHILGFPLDYFSARLTGLLLVWGALIACRRLLRTHYSPVVAKLGVLPALFFFAAASDADFVHYSSEHVSLLLLAWAGYWLLRQAPDGAGQSDMLIGAFTAGLLPWAKLQSAPLAALLGLCAAVELIRAPTHSKRDKLRRGCMLVLAALAPSVLIITLVTATGQLEHCLRSYFLQNLIYASEPFPLREALGRFWTVSLETGNLPVHLFGCLMVILAACVCIRSRMRARSFFWFGGAFTAIALLCILTPRRAYLHYMLFLSVPLCMWTGSALGEWWNRLASNDHRTWRRVAALFVFLAALPVMLRCLRPPPAMLGALAEDWRRPYSALGKLLRDQARPGDRLAVWGWLNESYVESGLSQATRDASSNHAIFPSPQREYYRERYLADFKQASPVFFIDAVGPGIYALQDRALYDHTIFPALAEWIQRNYTEVIDVPYARLYVRSDRLSESPISLHHLRRIAEESRPYLIGGSPAQSLPSKAVYTKIMGRTVQLLLPPGELRWALAGTERSLVIDYGLHPDAARKNHSNGVELMVELHTAGQPMRPLLYRLINPQGVPTDRGSLSTQIVLPPFTAGTELVIRAGPGEHGDDSWDWLYLANVGFEHLPFFTSAQFPGFNRVPDRVSADQAYQIVKDGRPILMLPPPAELEFILNGDERHLHLDYGLQPGAYTDGGQTDGVVYQIELHRSEQPVEILLSRALSPVTVDDDRGTLSSEVLLPVTSPGDRLILKIDPKANSSWDWSYVSRFTLQ